jgi:hypothetical protein
MNLGFLDLIFGSNTEEIRTSSLDRIHQLGPQILWGSNHSSSTVTVSPSTTVVVNGMTLIPFLLVVRQN